MSQYIVVLITASSKREAERLTDKLLEHKLVACCSTTDVNSVFTWKGKIESSKEVLLIAKTQKRLFDAVTDLVKKYHSYEVPEIIALPIIDGNPAYLDWIKESTI